MTIVTVHDAKTRLSRLIADALEGEEIIIARRDAPVVRLVPVHPPAQRRFGALRDVIKVGPKNWRLGTGNNPSCGSCSILMR